MKKMKGFRTLLAYLLAGVMFFSAVPVWAEESAAEAPALETLIRVEDGVVRVYNEKTREWETNDDLTDTLTLEGDLASDILVNTVVDGDGLDWATALDVSAFEKDTSFTVAGSVTMQSEESSWGDEAEAVRAEAFGSQAATVTVEEDILAVSVCQTEGSEAGSSEDNPDFAEADALALEVRAYGDSGEETGGEKTQGEGPEATVNAEGSVTAEAAATGTEYVDADAKAVKATAYGENASAVTEIAEAVSAEASAVQTGTGAEEASARAEATALEAEAIGEGASSVIRIGGGVSAEAGAAAESGSADAYAYGVVAGTGEGDEGASVAIEIGEGISAEATATGEDSWTNAEAVALNVRGTGTYEINVGEDVAATAEAPDGQALAKSVEAYSNGGEISIHIGGSATAEINAADHEFVLEEFNGYEGAYAVRASASNGTVTVDVDEKIAATSTVSGDAPLGVEADAFGKDGNALVTAGEGVEGQVFIQAGDGGHAAVKVENGGITAETGGVIPDSDAVYAYAQGGGEAQISVVGDTAVSNSEEIPAVYGVGLYVEDADSAITAYFEGNVSAELNEVSDAEAETETVAMTLENAGDMEVTVEGDVTASGAQDNFGIYVEAAEGADTDILVDGTVSAEDGAIVLSGETTKIGENVTMTVWKLEPDEDGDVVAIGARDEETGKIVLAEDDAAKEKAAEAEKNIQYIIRVAAGQADYIGTEGTESYIGANDKTYNVAKEGDTVIVKLSIPAGYVIAGAYWDEDQRSGLLQDESGNYFLVMPRGGGVVLSVELEEKKKDESGQEEPADPPKKDESASADAQTMAVTRPAFYPATAAVQQRIVLEIWDIGHKVKISFYDNGEYEAFYENGTTGSGKYIMKDGRLFLVGDEKAENIEAAADFNAEKQIYELRLVLISNTEYTFELTKDNVNFLSGYCFKDK